MYARGSTTPLFVVGVVAAVLLAVSTGAVVLDEPADRIDDEVALQPGDNPYAYLDEDEELAVDVTEENPRIDAAGVNPTALSAQDALFYVTYEGDEYAEAWIEHDGTGVTFVVDGEPVESPERAARLTPADEAVPVGIEVDTRVADLAPGDRLIDEISVHARIAEPEDPGDDGPGDGPGGPGDGDDGGDGDDDADSPSPTAGPIVSMERPSPTVREIEVRSIVGGADTDIDLGGLRVGDPGIRLDALTFVRAAPGDASLVVRGSAEPPAETAPVPPGVDPLGYYAVAFAEPDGSVEEATATLEIDRDGLAAAGVAPERLAVYRETGAGWERAETTVVDADGETVRIEAVSPGLSAFAVAAERSALVPVEVTLSDDRVALGEPLTVDADVENVGPAPASDAEIRVETVGDGAIASNGTVALDADPGAIAAESVTVRFDEPGEHDLVLAGKAVEGEPALGSVTVTERRDGSGGDGGGADPNVGSGANAGGADGAGDGDGSAADGDQTGTELSDLELADLAGLAAFVAIVLATLFLVRRAPW